MNKDEFITEIAQRAGFTKQDVKVIIDTLISIFEESVLSNIEINIRGFGRLYKQKIKERNIRSYIDKNGKLHEPRTLSATERVIFRLGENIKFASRNKKEETIA